MKQDRFVGVIPVTQKISRELLLNQAEVNAELKTESVEYSDSKDDLEEL